MTLALPDSLRRSARWLGYGGLIPFLVLAPLSLLDSHHGFTWSMMTRNFFSQQDRNLTVEWRAGDKGVVLTSHRISH